MGRDPEYSARRVCPVVGCERDLEYRFIVQWSLFDFLDDFSCGQHLAFTERYWLAQTVDGKPPLVWVDPLWP